VAGALLLALGAPAQTNAPQMLLRVVDADTGQPVPGVKVRAWVRADPTDASGVSLIPLPKPESENFAYRITLSKDGYVGQYITWSKSQHDKIQDIPTNFLASLQKGLSIGGVVKNDKGEPVPGARVILSGPVPGDVGERVRSVVAPNFHAERTDADGQWRFGEAPRDLETLLFRVIQPDYVSTVFACQGAETELEGVVFLPKEDLLAGKAVMALGHGIELAGRVVNPAGQPVADAAITRNHEWRNPAAALASDADGRFKILNLRPGQIYLTIQAKGLAAQTLLLTLSNAMPESVSGNSPGSPPTDRSAGVPPASSGGVTPPVLNSQTRSELKIQLAPGKVFQGKVVDPSGQPIAGATAQMDRQELGPLEYDWSVATGADGRFNWDSAPDGPHPYFFSAAGYHPRSEPALVADGRDHVITLRQKTPGDKTMIDGQVADAVSKAPLPKFTLYVQEFTGRSASRFEQAVSNADGHYTAAVDTGADAYLISVGVPDYRVETSNMKAPGDGDLRLDFALEKEPGQSGQLYCLAGRFILDGYAGQINWTNQDIRLYTVVPPPALTATEPEEQRAEFEQFLETPAGQAWARSHRSYDAEVAGDGAFQIHDVPEGTYRLQGNLRQSPAEGADRIASLDTNIFVSPARGDSNAAVDLGRIEIPAQKTQQTLRIGDLAPAFEVKTLDGAPLRLADFRGKFVLLDFWATWCRPCVHETPFLKAACKSFGANARFAMISLSLDADPAAPEEFARKNDIQWTQGFLGEWSKSVVTPLYGVEGIPSIFLIAPDGKIIARDLRGEEISEAVAKVLGLP
jgi:thiol-disulfide isomerase/thioredoxin